MKAADISIGQDNALRNWEAYARLVNSNNNNKKHSIIDLCEVKLIIL
jgi:hypothetical protein